MVSELICPISQGDVYVPDALGFLPDYLTFTGDKPELLSQAVKTALERSDIVILLGEREKLMQSLDLPLEKKKKDKKPGSALILERDEKTLVVLPGSMEEMIPVFREEVVPVLRKKQPQQICTQWLKICGMGEREVREKIRDLLEDYENPSITVTNRTGEVDIRITARGESEKECRKASKPLVHRIKERFGKAIFAADEKKTLEEAVVDMLRDQKRTLSLAESCTGGALSARIVNVSGASEVFTHGFVTYSNRAKRKFLGVKKSTLKKCGAVSEKCAKEMAKGCRFVSGTDISLSVTGFAGPDGGTDEYPVGTVFMGCSYNDREVVREYHFSGSRSQIREQAVVQGLCLLRECMMEGVRKSGS